MWIVAARLTLILFLPRPGSYLLSISSPWANVTRHRQTLWKKPTSMGHDTWHHVRGCRARCWASTQFLPAKSLTFPVQKKQNGMAKLGQRWSPWVVLPFWAVCFSITNGIQHHHTDHTGTVCVCVFKQFLPHWRGLLTPVWLLFREHV